jgi:hypothetical protein
MKNDHDHPEKKPDSVEESTTIPARGRDGLNFSAIGGKRQGRKVPQSLRVEPDAKHPVWKTQSRAVDLSKPWAVVRP